MNQVSLVKPVEYRESGIQCLEGFMWILEQDRIALPLEFIVDNAEVFLVQEIPGFNDIGGISRYTQVDIVDQAKLQVVEVDLTVEDLRDPLSPLHIERGPFGTQEDLLLRFPYIPHTRCQVKLDLVVGGIVWLKVNRWAIGDAEKGVVDCAPCFVANNGTPQCILHGIAEMHPIE